VGSFRTSKGAGTGLSVLVQASYAMMLETDIQATSKPSIALLRCQWTSSRNYTLRAGVSRDPTFSK